MSCGTTSFVAADVEVKKMDPKEAPSLALFVASLSLFLSKSAPAKFLIEEVRA